LQPQIFQICTKIKSKVVRGVALKDQSYALIQDEVQTGNTSVTVRWRMLTSANAEIISPTEILLKKIIRNYS
jgi:hypothetical protein